MDGGTHRDPSYAESTGVPLIPRIHREETLTSFARAPSRASFSPDGRVSALADRSRVTPGRLRSAT